MSLHTRPQYRWNGTKIEPGNLRETAAEFERLLRAARARNAAADNVKRPPIDRPTTGDAFMWRPHGAEGVTGSEGPTTSKRATGPRAPWPARSLPWVMLIAIPGIFGVLLAPDLMYWVSLIR